MKSRLSIILLMLAYYVVAEAQTVESIRSDADYLWAEGKDVRPSLADNKAIDKLLEKLAASDILPVEEWVRGPLWKTYRNDIRSTTLALATPDGVMRYIAWRDVEKIFVNRWRKVKELVQWAQKSVGSDPDVARTYISWAETYLASLPPVELALRRLVEEIRTMLGSGRTDAVHLRNIENEVAFIRKAFGQQKPTVKETPRPPRITVAVTRDTMEAIKAIRWADLPKEVCVLAASDSTLAPIRVFSDTTMVQIPSWNCAILLQADYWMKPSFGVMLVAGRGKYGAYISARSVFTSVSASYECLSDGTCDFGRFWASGNNRTHRFSLAAGPVYAFHKHFSAYGGIGYGRQDVLWEDNEGNWAKVSDLSARGFLLDAGVLWIPGHFTFGLGTSLTAFRAASGIVSVGVSF